MRAGKVKITKQIIQDFLRFPGDCRWFIAEMLKFPGDWKIESIKNDNQRDIYEFMIVGNDFPEVMGEIKECMLIIHREQISENEYKDRYGVKELR